MLDILVVGYFCASAAVFLLVLTGHMIHEVRWD
jgi:hypothetical protein